MWRASGLFTFQPIGGAVSLLRHCMYHHRNMQKVEWMIYNAYEEVANNFNTFKVTLFVKF